MGPIGCAIVLKNGSVMASKCAGDEVCSAQLDCASCRDVLSSSRPVRAGSAPGIPVRRFGELQPFEPDLEYEVEHDASARTIAEYGAAAVWMAALSAACVAGVVLYVS
jgi:hypothetical protein